MVARRLRDERDLARAIRALHADPALGARLAERACAAAEPYRWARQRRVYPDVIEAYSTKWSGFAISPVMGSVNSLSMQTLLQVHQS